VYNLTKTTRKVRKIIEGIGKIHGLYKDERMFLNDDCAPFLIELGPIPPARLLREYRKLVLYIPDDMSYILACKLIAGRANKDFGDIAVLCRLLNVSTREQARDIVSHFFPDHALQEFYDLARNLDEIFRGEQ
jgi:hypothetical protein